MEVSIVKYTLPSLAAGLAFSLMMNGPAAAGDPDAGRIKAKQTCRICHGMDGIATLPMAANLAGQQELYLIEQLTDYKTGKRQHAQMSIIANMLSTEDIKNVAAWYSQIVVTVKIPE